MIPPARFLLCFLFLFFLQRWRLAASTPGGEEMLKSLAEKTSSFFEDGVVEENLIPSPPLDTIQAAPRTIEEGAFRETSPMNTHSTTDPIDLGNRIMELPWELIEIFLRSPKAKQDAYKADHEQAVQELLKQYSQDPELAPQIVTWRKAVCNWDVSSGQEKEDCYQQAEILVSKMPQELYQLAALSQAMKILEDATAYSRYLPLALAKYNEDTENLSLKSLETSDSSYHSNVQEPSIPCSSSVSATFQTGSNNKAYQAYFLSKLDTINNNIKKLEELADTIVRLSQQKNHYLTSAAAVREAAAEFKEAAEKAQQSIECYLQCGQKMKEGDAPAASLLRLQGRSSECASLESWYRGSAVHANVEGDSIRAQNFLKAAGTVFRVSVFLENAPKYRKSGAVEALEALEQMAQYYFQAAQAFVNGDESQAENFSKAAEGVLRASVFLESALEYRKSGAVEALEALKLGAQYYFQAAQAFANGDESQAENFSKAAEGVLRASVFLESALKYRKSGDVEALEALEQMAQYYFQAAQAFVNGDESQAENFSKAAEGVLRASLFLESALEYRKSGAVEALETSEKMAKY